MPEYVENLTRSVMQLDGTSPGEYGEIEFPDVTGRGFNFTEGSAKLSSTLTADWMTEDGGSHSLYMVLVSTENTIGFWAGGVEFPPVVINHYLAIGFPSPPGPGTGHPDPKIATLVLRGTYKSSSGAQKISGHGYLLAVDYEVSGERIRGFHYNLWIEELGTYVTFLWSSLEGTLYCDPHFPTPEEDWIPLGTIPAARVLEIRVKLI
jgi:hypothetical protein